MTRKNKKSKQKSTSPADKKESKLFNNLAKITEQFIAGKGFKPLTEDELMQRLALPPQHIPVFQKVLHYLTEQGLLENFQGKYVWKKSRRTTLKGIARMHPRGFGFVQLIEPSEYTQDIFIPKHLTKNAVHGDEVEVEVSENVSEKGPEGKIVAILSRARTHMAGVISFIDRKGEMVAHVPLLGAQQRVVVQPTDEFPLKVGDRIVMEVLDWGSKETETSARFSHYLGHISDPSCDISAAIEEYELRTDFPKQAITEAESFGSVVERKDLKDREDLQKLITFTIDPDTAKDFDDAISLTKDKKGNYHLGVHIADVSHYVKPGSALDLEAQQRCNSVYFPGTVLPMLPHALSSNLCSLKEKVVRLTVSVHVTFNPQGDQIDYRISRSFIKSSKRFTYKEAKQVLDGKKKNEHLPALQLMVELCRLLKEKRFDRGSIEFSLPELVVLVDEKGVPTGTDYITYDITHQMIEEFMLKANEIIAWDLAQKGKNLTYRIHAEPAEENLKDFSLLAAAFGFRVPDLPTAQDLQKLFEEAGETPYANYLASSYIRRMRMAAYSPENIGHYGLSLTHYCHFTSPIRRYVDLVVHRILFGESDDLEYLQQISEKSSNQERVSAKAEQNVVLLKKLRLLQTTHEKDPYRTYEAVITKVKNFGIYFDILDFLVEGFIHISELDDDYLIYEEDRMRLRGSRKGAIYACGDRLNVLLKDVNFVTLESKWYATKHEPAEILIPAPEKKKKGAKAKKGSPKARTPVAKKIPVKKITTKKKTASVKKVTKKAKPATEKKTPEKKKKTTPTKAPQKKKSTKKKVK